MSETITDHYDKASAKAKNTSVTIGNLALGSLPARKLTPKQEADVISVLNSWGFEGNDLQTVLPIFAQHYNQVFSRKLSVNGVWGSQPRLAMETYYLALESWRESVDDMNRLAFKVERDNLKREVTTQQKGGEERIKIGTRAEYNAVRKVLQSSDYGIISLDYVHPSGEISNIGRFNTEAGGDLVEEEGLLGVINELGFDSFGDFAKAYNQRFPHRAPDAQRQILDNATYVDQNINHRDIKIGDKAFKNVRLAVQIWVAHERMPKTESDPVRFGNYEFSLTDLRKVIPNLKYEDALILEAREAKFLSDLLEFAPSGRMPEFSATFNRIDKMLDQSMTNRGMNQLLSQSDFDSLMEEFTSLDPVLDKTGLKNLDNFGRLATMIRPEFSDASMRMSNFFYKANELDWSDEPLSITQLTNSFCNAINGNWCYFGG